MEKITVSRFDDNKTALLRTCNGDESSRIAMHFASKMEAVPALIAQFEVVRP